MREHWEWLQRVVRDTRWIHLYAIAAIAIQGALLFTPHP